ncbi:prolyl oligopeptidase family serine peptidase [Halobacillus locisalis]|uniref:Prolyl oligopeptidase family serine peptidase n=1 Tax=Halobacillus locisalis TaxID=220753 RepID=A0A838CWS8_9BACI|nr:prolyl oligopeptidase family serine peptidase [Halobacillus locisalis]MBA2176373.1 prolyl oligopeptidase family serine peptidase [Halobacillus locisalis]
MKKIMGVLLVVIIFTAVVVFFFGAENGKATLLKEEEVPLGVDGVTGYKIQYKSQKDSIPGLLVEPVEKEKDLPLLIVNRGGIGKVGGDPENELKALSFWAEQGYVVVESYYRDHVVSGYRPSTNEGFVQDILDLKEVMEQWDGVDVSNTVMLGYSRGGLVSLLSIQQQTDLRAVATVGTITDLQKQYAEQPDPVKEQIEALLGTPDENAQLYERLHPDSWIQDMDVPVLMIHGERDQVVPVERARAFADRMKQHHSIHEYKEIENGTHLLTFSFPEYSAEVLNWFDQHIE